MPELTHLTGTVIKSDDLPDELKSAKDEADIWAYASVEVSDREKDVVRIKGISLKNHTKSQPIPILASHERQIGVDGFPVVGRAVAFKECTYKAGDVSAPALAFGMKFAPSPFGKVMKSLYEDGSLNNFSIGFSPKKHSPLKDGGFDFTESELMEISACVLGMNQNAHVMRALGMESDAERFAGVLKSQMELLASGINAHFTQLTKRLDDLESTVVSQAKQSEAAADKDSDVETQVDYGPLLSALEGLKSSLLNR
jgi:hypothetical protein